MLTRLEFLECLYVQSILGDLCAPEIVDAQLDTDGKTGSIVITTEHEGDHQEWLISSEDIKPVYDEENPQVS